MPNRLLLRQQLRLLRQQLTSQARTIAAQQLANQINHYPIFSNSQRIAAYIANDHEIDPKPLLKMIWQNNKQVYLPKLDIVQKRLNFFRYETDDQLELNRYNISEPLANPHNLLAAEALDLVLLPLVGFDATRNRLGMGAGYYDRTFAFLQNAKRPCKPYLVGLAYELQKTTSITPESWDVKLDAIITENFIY